MSHLLPLLGSLRDAGCDVSLLCLGEGGLALEAEQRGLPVSVLPMTGPRDPRVLRILRRWLVGGRGTDSDDCAVRWDVVHTHGMRANLPVRLVLTTSRRRPCLFTTVHSDLRLDYASGGLAQVYSALDRLTLGPVDAVITVSEGLRALVAARGYPTEKLITIHSGLESSWPANPGGHQQRKGGPLRAREVDKAGGRIGMVARLVPVKDVDLALEAVSLVRASHPGVELVIVGDGPERPRLEARALEVGLGGTVRFVGQVVKVDGWLAQFDAYLVTSVFEGGVSMSVLEAMSAGLPVVATSAGGVEEAVVHGETGYLVSRDQTRSALAGALARRLTALLEDDELRRRMGEAGAARVEQHFTARQTALRTMRAYERCLATKARTA